MSATGGAGKRRILMVEDHVEDVELVNEALAEAGISLDLCVVKDGVEALAMLRGESACGEQSFPALVLLDLNLPRKNGFEVLAEIKADPALKRLPVVVFTTSRAERDIARAYDLCASSYIAKPVDFEALIDVLRIFAKYWMDAVCLPPQMRGHPRSS